VRKTYLEQLDQVTEGLVAMSRLAAQAVRDATTAVVCDDLAVAGRVIAGDDRLNDLYRSIDELALDVLARQQPVASDLRSLVTALRIATDLERAGDYAVHIAKIARRRSPAPVLPEPIRPLVREMGERAAHLTAKAGDVIRRRDLTLARELVRDDEAVDALHRQLFAMVLDDRPHFAVEQVVDVILVGRYFERLADHAVAVSEAVSYLVTGQHRTLTA
jgi:phosphate transport system protein